VAPGLVRFANDSWNSGLLESEVLAFDPNEDQKIDVDFGGLHPSTAPGGRTLGEFRLRFNGREVLKEARHYHPALACEVAFGYNAIRASAADVRFRGERLVAERLSRWPGPVADFSPIALTLRWPGRLPVGRAEPLLVTGRTGAANVVSVRYVDPSRVVVGYDSWGRGRPESQPVPAAPGSVTTLVIFLGNLFDAAAAEWSALPPEVCARVAERLLVRFDGQLVFDVPAAPYPTLPADVRAGLNEVGASSCAQHFSGEVLRVERGDPMMGR